MNLSIKKPKIFNKPKSVCLKYGDLDSKLQVRLKKCYFQANFKCLTQKSRKVTALSNNPSTFGLLLQKSLHKGIEFFGKCLIGTSRRAGKACFYTPNNVIFIHKN